MSLISKSSSNSRLHALSAQICQNAAVVQVPEIRSEDHLRSNEVAKGKGKFEGKGKGKGNMKLFEARLESRVQEYDGVHTFHFKPLAEDIPFEAGMYTHLKAPGDGGVRHMSFASAPEEGRMSFSMDLASGSAFKLAMSSLQVGDAVQLFKNKFKHFELDPDLQTEVVFIAGGLGITPIRSLLFSHRCSTVDWRLVHIARDGKFLYADEFASFDMRLQVRTDHSGAAEAVKRAAQEKPRAWFFICGSGRFVDGMQLLLAEVGVSADQIRVESFQ